MSPYKKKPKAEDPKPDVAEAQLPKVDVVEIGWKEGPPTVRWHCYGCKTTVDVTGHVAFKPFCNHCLHELRRDKG